MNTATKARDVSDQVKAIDWSSRRPGLGNPAEAALREGVQGSRLALRRGARLPQPHRHGPPRLRARRIQILLLPAAAAGQGSADLSLSTPRGRRQSLARNDGNGCSLPGQPCRLHRARHAGGQTRWTLLKGRRAVSNNPPPQLWRRRSTGGGATLLKSCAGVCAKGPPILTRSYLGDIGVTFQVRIRQIRSGSGATCHG